MFGLKQFQKITRLVVFGNLWVSFGAVCMYASTVILHHLKLDWRLAACIFMATLFIYNYHRLFRKKKIYRGVISDRHRWIIAHDKLLQASAILGLILSVYLFLPYINERLILRFLPFASLALFYVVPVWKKEDKWLRIRDIPYVKIFLVASVWTFVTVLLPFLCIDPNWFPDTAVLITAAQRFMFIFAITMPFDIRDLEHDRSVGLTTFAGRLGVEGVKKASGVLLVLVALLAVLGALTSSYTLPCTLALLSSCMLTSWFISGITKDSSEWTYAAFLEGTMVDQLVWLTVFSFLF